MDVRRHSHRGQRVLVVNDIVTTGRGMSALARVATDAGVTIAGGAWFLSRGRVDVGEFIGGPVSHVCDLLLSHWSPASCPLCARSESLSSAIEIN